MIAVLAVVFTAIAAALHVVFFVLESVRWSHPRVWRLFGLRDQAAADLVRPMAYNQGFYNLFLALGALVGLVLFAVAAPGAAPHTIGATLMVFVTATMVGAALVLLSTGRRYARAAALQGAPAAVAFVLTLIA